MSRICTSLPACIHLLVRLYFILCSDPRANCGDVYVSPDCGPVQIIVHAGGGNYSIVPAHIHMYMYTCRCVRGKYTRPCTCTLHVHVHVRTCLLLLTYTVPFIYWSALHCHNLITWTAFCHKSHSLRGYTM